MEQPENQLLTQLLLDVKQDVSAIKKDLAEIKSIAQDNTIELVEHTRRSTASEARLDVQEEKLEKFIKDMEPVQDHVRMVSTLTKAGWIVLKGLAALVSLAGAILGLLKIR